MNLSLPGVCHWLCQCCVNGDRRSSWRTILKTLACAVWIVATFTAQGATAQDDPRPKVTALRVGFAGSYKVGYWTPVSVTIHGGDKDLVAHITVTVPDGDGVPSQVTTPDARPLQIRAKQDTEALVFAKIGQMYADVTVRLLVNSRVVAERTYQSASDPELGGALPAENELIVTLGPPIAIEVQEQTEDNDVGQFQKTQIARLSDAAQLPSRWYGYEGIDALVIATSDPNVYRQLSSQSTRVEALSQWIERGGRLLLSVGKQSDEVAGEESPLLPFLPGKIQSQVTLRQAGALETYADTTERIDAADVAAGRRFQLVAPKFVNVHGKVEAAEGDLPLVIRSAYGFGEIVVTAFDIDRSPITDWSAREALFNKLLRRTKTQAAAETTGGAATTLGYNDLAGQLRSGLDQFRGVQLVPFAIVAVLIVSYILVIGPIDFWFVKHVLRRMEMTWVTFPLAVLAFSIGAYFLAGWLKGDQLRVNQVDVIDLDVNRKLLRGTMWANVFSPQHDAYDLSLIPQLPQGLASTSVPNNVLVSWMGLPGNSLGAMGGGAAATAFSEPYKFSSSLDRMLGVPIAVWSTKAFTSRWTAPIEAPLAFDLKSRPDGILLGSIENHLDVPLTEAYLLYGPWAWPLGAIAPGTTIELDGRADPQRLDSYLKPHPPDSDFRQTYDAGARNVDRIVQVMGFYEAAGGKSYATLSNRYQAFIDMSNQLQVGRAVLVARTTARTQLTNGDQPLGSAQDQQWTLFRVVTDVAPATNE